MLLLLLTLPDLPDEDRLLDQARRGRKRAIARIYEAYFDAVYQFIRWRVDDPTLAEDLTSDVFFKFLNALQNDTAPHHSLRGWLFRVARNVIYDFFQQRITTTELDEQMPASGDYDAEWQLMRSLDDEQVRQAVRQLSDEQQEVLICRFGHMLSLQDTADAMGKSVSAIKSLQFRAINAMRVVLAEAGLEAEHGTA